MKIYAYILIILFGVLTAQCEKEILEENQDIPSSDKENEDYNSYWYYSYEATHLVNAETLGMETPFSSIWKLIQRFTFGYSGRLPFYCQHRKGRQQFAGV